MMLTPSFWSKEMPETVPEFVFDENAMETCSLDPPDWLKAEMEARAKVAEAADRRRSAGPQELNPDATQAQAPLDQAQVA